jgi:hypothetical protein
MTVLRNRAKRLRRLVQALAIVVAVGITISWGARSFASTVEFAERPSPGEFPEPVELFGTGALLVVVAASARRVVRRASETAEAGARARVSE